jgi:SAM-dependent methyltransferase
MDVHVDALAAGGRVSRQLGVEPSYVCGDIERLPLGSASVDVVFSYSVLQHLEKEKVGRIFKEIARVLRPSGCCYVQLPNVLGPFNVARQIKRGFRAARPGTFEMRYWSAGEIRRMVEEAGMRTQVMRADGYFSQNPQLSDLDLLSTAGKLLVLLSHAGCRAADLFPPLASLADSLWVEAQSPRR